jgi:hypothetical protein
VFFHSEMNKHHARMFAFGYSDATKYLHINLSYSVFQNVMQSHYITDCIQLYAVSVGAVVNYFRVPFFA